jgi:hypothetical protein
MPPIAKQPSELAAPEQQPDFEAANENLLDEHGVFLPKSVGFSRLPICHQL